MIKVILLAFLFVVCAVTEDAKSEPSLSASKNQEYFGSGADRGAIYKDKDLEFTDAENRIIQDVFSPDYYEPNIILDYRYLMSGGRGYARSDGGQILILPRRDQMPPPQNNYDTLLEYLRLKHLEQISKPFMPNSRLRENYAEFDEGNMGDNMRQNMGGNMRQNMGGNMRENMGGNMGGNMGQNMGGNMRQNMGGNNGQNMGGNMRENMGGNLRENMGGNMGQNMGGNMRGNMGQSIGGNMRQNMGQSMEGNRRQNMGGNMRQNMGGNMRRGDMRDERKDSGYRREKLDQHDIEDKFSSDAELGSALYNH